LKRQIVYSSLALLFLFAITTSTVFALYTTTNPWLMERHDQRRTGFTTSPAPNDNQTVWSVGIQYTYTSVMPVVFEGKVIYVSSSRVYALDEATGVQLWQSASLTSLSSPLTIDNGKLYVGSSSGYAYCLNATTGAKLWENQITSTGQVTSGPVVSNGKAYFGTTDNFIFALHADTGLNAWSPGPGKFTVGGPIYSSLTLDGDLLYFGCDDGKLYALNVSGSFANLKWTYTTNGQIRSTPVVEGEKVFFGSFYLDHAVFALDKITGILIWKYSLATTYTISNTVAVADGIVYFAPDSGTKVYALYANATAGANYTENDPAIKFWSTTIGGSPNAPTVANGKLFISASLKLYALHISDGTTYWTYTFTNYSPGNPIIADGRLFIAQAYTMYCFGNPFPPMTYHYTVNAGGQDFDIMLVVANATAGPLNATGLITQKKLVYSLQGIPYTKGWSNITIPNALLSGIWLVTINGSTPITGPTLVDNGTHTSVYFTYQHSTRLVEIYGNTVIPEFPTTTILLVLGAISMVTAVLTRRKLNRKQPSPLFLSSCARAERQ